MTKEEYLKSLSGTEVAIIGYALRFPGASNADDFWKNIAGEKESIQFLSDEELAALNVSSDTYNRAEFVRAVVEDIENKEYFDHSFFGYTPDEAMVLDPQTRIFHELVWEAIEHAGQAAQIDRQKIGLFAGGASSFSHELLSLAAGLGEKIGPQIASRLMNKDYLVSRVAYALNLKGPCFTIQTACSTSLVALHVAVRSVLTGECKMALAGGISIQPEKNKGYLYEEGGVLSNDGHCRAFDADSSGTLFGEGGCVVMLKRLKDAIQDNDTIHAVIKGSAINNDGKRKVGFTAPSIEGQADVIKLAHRIARVEPASLQYIEAHGTGTKLGDPIELQALQLAFGLSQKKSCAIGSVKTNVGHLDTAAGIAGLMKTVLALKNKKLPPSLNFKSPNPNANFDDSPFYVNQHLKDWESNGSFRKAGVSSFGIGGTNAHVVIEEAPVFEVKKEENKNYYIISVSGKTQTAVDKQKENIASFAREGNVSLADISYSLQTGRTPFKYRSFIVTNTNQELIENWSKRDENWILPRRASEGQTPLIFMFGGQGSQYYGMSKALYLNFEMYRTEVDACLSIIQPSLKKEILDIILAEGSLEDSKQQIPTRLTQPLLFVIEYSIARVLINLGLTPDAMIGHSIGEYVAACISEVLSLEDALDLVICRGELMESADAGAMISVSVAVEKVNRFISKEVALAAVNSDKSCVMAGTEPGIRSIEAQLTDLEIPFRRLHTNRAFHSSLMEKVLPAFLAKVKEKKWSSPSIPYISNLTGKYIQTEDVVNPTYWINHLRNTVYFGAGISELDKLGGGIFIEIGTGKNLGTFVRDQLGVNTTVIETIRHPKADVFDDFYFLKAIGDLWCSGKDILWEQIYKDQRPSKITLPTYPFERSRFWNDADLATLLSLAGRRKASGGKDIHAFVPVWRRSLKSINQQEGKKVLVFRDREQDFELIVKTLGAFNQVSVVNSNSLTKFDWNQFSRELRQQSFAPEVIVYLPGVEGDSKVDSSEIEVATTNLLTLYQQVSRIFPEKEIDIKVVLHNTQEVIGDDVLCVAHASLLGLTKVASVEYKKLTCTVFDIEKETGMNLRQAQILANDLLTLPDYMLIAYRRGNRWTLQLEEDTRSDWKESGIRLSKDDTVLITGGLSGIGLEVASYFLEHYKVNVALIGRSQLPEEETWPEWMESVSPDDPVYKKIQVLIQLRKYNCKVDYFNANVSDLVQLRQVLSKIKLDGRRIGGVIHAAGTPERSALELMDSNSLREQLEAKAYGVLALEQALKEEELSFFVNFSSLNSTKPFFGQGGYTAANAVLEAFCHQNSLKCSVVKTIGWDTFGETGMAIQIRDSTFENLRGFRFDVIHPLIKYIAQNVNGSYVAVSHLSSSAMWVLNEHRIVDSKPTLPAKAYIEIIYATLQWLHPGNKVVIQNLLISSPLVVEIDDITMMKTLLEKRGEVYNIRIVSKTVDSYVEHVSAEARVEDLNTNESFLITEILSDAEEISILKQTNGNGSSAELGLRWHNLQKMKLSDGEGLAYLELDEDYRADTLSYHLHPALLDIASGFYYIARKQDAHYLPYYYESISIYGQIPDKIYSHVTVKVQDKNSMVFDVRLLDPNGKELVFIKGFTYKSYAVDIGNSKKTLIPETKRTTNDSTQDKPIIKPDNPLVLNNSQIIQWLERTIHSDYKHLIISKHNFNQFDFKIEKDSDVIDTIVPNDQLVLRLREGLSATFIEATTPTEKILAEDWQNFFGIKQIGVLDDFFELGGDSLKSTTIISRINKVFKRSVSLGEFFRNANIKKLAAFIDQASSLEKIVLPKKTERKTYYPLSLPQRRIYFLQQIQKSQIQFNITEAFKFTGVLDLRHVQRTIDQLLERHDSLRTRLIVINGLPYQQIIDSIKCEVEYAKIQEADIGPQLSEFRRPFDFRKPPYIRFGLFKTNEESFYLCVDIHHIVADGTSLLVLMKEFWKLYQNEPLPPVKFNAIDYLEWKTKLTNVGHFEKQRQFWKNYMSGNISKVKLPFDSFKADGNMGVGGNYVLALDKETSFKLKAISRKYDVTEFVFMVALFSTFLSKLTARQDIIIGIPTAGRDNEGFNEVVGMFVNTTVLRNIINPEIEFAEYLQSVKQNTLDVFDNQDFQYEQVLEMVRKESGQVIDDLFNVILNYRNMFVSVEDSTKKEGIKALSAGLEDTSAKHDLSLFVYDNKDYFVFTCNYPSAYFNADTIKFLMGEFQELAKQIAELPTAKIKNYNIFQQEREITAGHQASVFDI